MATSSTHRRSAKAQTSFPEPQASFPLRGRVFMPSRLRNRRYAWRGILQVIGLCAGMGLIGIGYWWDWPQKAINAVNNSFLNVSKNWGFCVQDIMVDGRHFATPEKILDAVGLKRGDPIFAKSPQDIKADLEKISWIEKTTVQRFLPGKILITLKERKPIAIWQHQKIHYLVDATGAIVSTDRLQEFRHLPIIVGGDAPVSAPKALDMLKQFPSIAQQMTALIRVAGRRWDIQLDKKMLIKLPELNMKDALDKLSFLMEKEKLNPEEVLWVDLRLPDKVTVRLMPMAAARLTQKGGKEA